VKKVISLLLTVIIMTISVPYASASNSYRDTLRVGLSYGSTAQSSVSFSSKDELNVFDTETMALLATVPAGTSLPITLSSEGAFVSEEYLAEHLGTITIESAAIIYYNGTPYRGSFELRSSNGRITVINVVNTEEYLTSVLGKEMSASWPIEALKAQAICARNYAVCNINKHSTYGFDICATVDCQVYGGVNSEGEKTRQAVPETKGMLVTYQGQIVPLYYFSCDGGYTEDSENVWKNAEGYLRGKKDIYEDESYIPNNYASWSVTMTKAEVEEILAKKNINIGELLDITINSVSDNNGVTSMTFVGTEGSKTVTKTATRTTLSLNSQAYTIEKSGGEFIKAEIVKPIDMELNAMFILSGNGVSKPTGEIYRLTENGIEKIIIEEEPETEEETKEAGYSAYTFVGHGWGHLVGMSQWGAYSMAKAGKTFEDILNFYYTDIKITKG
jgi:stage II sporulation protein D